MIIDTFDMTGIKTYLVSTENMSYIGAGGGSAFPPIAGWVFRSIFAKLFREIFDGII